ncbi:MAG: acyl-CoA/acyl-ACP dehydrogenase [Candidatus Thermoplasmatota archaeon]|nr:acyl-CoA/acyl-ACP dehydrogenase [Candidatus Thermoplasmatota archaeon]
MTAIPSEFSRISSHSTETTITSDVPIAAGGSSDFLLMTDQSGRTLLVKDKINVRKIQKPLGFRAITWGGVETKNSQYEDLGKGKLEEIFLKQVNLEITAMALGIAEGAIEKTLEYTKVRKVFNTPLKDFGPVAAAVTNMKGEIDLVKHSLDSERREENSEVLRHASLELALNSARTSVQYHGGYGYFESFGIEKFYRDAMAMKMIFGGLKPRELLYRKIYGSDSGRI